MRIGFGVGVKVADSLYRGQRRPAWGNDASSECLYSIDIANRNKEPEDARGNREELNLHLNLTV